MANTSVTIKVEFDEEMVEAIKGISERISKLEKDLEPVFEFMEGIKKGMKKGNI